MTRRAYLEYVDVDVDRAVQGISGCMWHALLFPAIDGHMTTGNQMSHGNEYPRWQASIASVFSGLQNSIVCMLVQNLCPVIYQDMHLAASLGKYVHV